MPSTWLICGAHARALPRRRGDDESHTVGAKVDVDMVASALDTGASLVRALAMLVGVGNITRQTLAGGQVLLGDAVDR